MLETKEQIASDMLTKIGRHDRMLLKSRRMSEASMAMGMSIRNRYGLWLPTHPLTLQWHFDRQEGGTKHIVDGIDCHPQHPDQVSADILTIMANKLHEMALQKNHPVARFQAMMWRNP